MTGKSGTVEERFWPKVNKDGPLPDPKTGVETCCWVWTAHRNNHGYGTLDKRYAHRISYSLRHGAIPDGLVIDHLCRTPFCVNPDHLQPVPQMVNTQRQGMRCNNKSGHRGVHWSKAARKWSVQVTANYKVHNGGHFANLEDAARAAEQLRRELHG